MRRFWDPLLGFCFVSESKHAYPRPQPAKEHIVLHPPYPDACSANRMRGESLNNMVCKLRPGASPQIFQQSWEVIESEGSALLRSRMRSCLGEPEALLLRHSSGHAMALR